MLLDAAKLTPVAVGLGSALCPLAAIVEARSVKIRD